MFAVEVEGGGGGGRGATDPYVSVEPEVEEGSFEVEEEEVAGTTGSGFSEEWVPVAQGSNFMKSSNSVVAAICQQVRENQSQGNSFKLERQGENLRLFDDAQQDQLLRPS
jgi:hypothetical protein